MTIISSSKKVDNIKEAINRAGVDARSVQPHIYRNYQGEYQLDLYTVQVMDDYSAAFLNRKLLEQSLVFCGFKDSDSRTILVRDLAWVGEQA